MQTIQILSKSTASASKMLSHIPSTLRPSFARNFSQPSSHTFASSSSRSHEFPLRSTDFLSSVHALKSETSELSATSPMQGRSFHFRSPVCMGRRSSKIAMRKGAQDAKKAKLYGKIGKQIVSVVRAGGPNPASNSALALLLSQVRLYDIPKDIVERNIKKASEKGQADYVESNYEVYGVGGVGIVLDVLTDNNFRAAASVREVVKKGGGKMADPGSVMFNFNRCGVVAVKAEGIDADALLLASMYAGADDIAEAEVEDDEEPWFKVITPMESFFSVKTELENAGLPVIQDNSGLVMLPVSFVEPDEEARELNIIMMDKLLELDDVDAVYSNQQ